jgi:sugar fermentation stimulation protein A
VQYPNPLKTGLLIKRYKRFLADVELADGSVLTMHCANTGSMKNCMIPGGRIWYSTSANPARKYPNTWEFLESETGGLIGINTSIANALVREAIEHKVIASLGGYDQLRSEVKYGAQNSRVDFLLERIEPSGSIQSCYVEVKNVSLCVGDGLGLFPDAVTTRGQKHLEELIAMVQAGHRAVLLFCVQHSEIQSVGPADLIDPDYGRLLRQAAEKGVELLAYRASMNMPQASVKLDKELAIELS